jgi:N-acetylglucosamine-6-phosphate deacetylase
MIEACRGALVMVTMAPEVEGVDEVARFFFDQGIVCSAGHTSAKYRDGMLAIALGFRTLTHAFNAMPPLDHREPSLWRPSSKSRARRCRSSATATTSRR